MSQIELRVFASLQAIFKERGLSIPMNVNIAQDGLTGKELVYQLNLKPEQVEAVFINGLVYNLKHRINPGDRVGLVPPGLPSIYRFQLGFYNQED